MADDACDLLAAAFWASAADGEMTGAEIISSAGNMAGTATTGAATIGEGAAARSVPLANPGKGGGVNGRLRLGFTSVEDGQRKESTKRPRGFVLVDDLVASSDFATALSAGDLISPTSSAVNATSPALNRANRAAILMREVDIFMAASK